jgi:hypothetical protein
MSILFLSFKIMISKYYKLPIYFSKAKAKAELEAKLEGEALPEALTFCWKGKHRERERKRKRLGWKRNQHWVGVRR